MSMSIGNSGQVKVILNKVDEAKETVVGAGSWTSETIKQAGIDLDGEDKKYFIGVYTNYYRFDPDAIKTDFPGKNIQSPEDLKAAIDEKNNTNVAANRRSASVISEENNVDEVKEAIIGDGSWNTETINAAGIDLNSEDKKYFIGVYTNYYRFDPDAIKADFPGKNIQSPEDLKAAIDEKNNTNVAVNRRSIINDQYVEDFNNADEITSETDEKDAMFDELQNNYLQGNLKLSDALATLELIGVIVDTEQINNSQLTQISFQYKGISYKWYVNSDVDTNPEKSWNLNEIRELVHNTSFAEKMNDIIINVYGQTTSSINIGIYHNWVNGYIESLFNGQDSITMTEEELAENVKNAFKDFLVQKQATDEKNERENYANNLMNGFKSQLSGDYASQFESKMETLKNNFVNNGDINKKTDFENDIKAIFDEVKAAEEAAIKAEREKEANNIADNYKAQLTDIKGTAEIFANDSRIKALINDYANGKIIKEELESGLKSVFDEIKTLGEEALKLERNNEATGVVNRYKAMLVGESSNGFENRNDVKKLVAEYADGKIDKSTLENSLQNIVDEINEDISNPKTFNMYEVIQLIHSNDFADQMSYVIKEVYGNTSTVNIGTYHDWVNGYTETLFNGKDSLTISKEKLAENVKNAFKEFLTENKKNEDAASKREEAVNIVSTYKAQFDGDTAKDFENCDDVKKLISDYVEGIIDKEAFESSLQEIANNIKSADARKRAAEAEIEKSWSEYDIIQFAHNKIGNDMKSVITEVYGDNSSINLDTYHNWVNTYAEILINGKNSISMSENELVENIKSAFKEFLAQNKQKTDRENEVNGIIYNYKTQLEGDDANQFENRDDVKKLISDYKEGAIDKTAFENGLQEIADKIKETANTWNISKIRDFAHNGNIIEKINDIITEQYGSSDTNINPGTYHNWVDKYAETLLNGKESISITEQELAEKIENAFKEFLVQNNAKSGDETVINNESDVDNADNNNNKKQITSKDDIDLSKHESRRIDNFNTFLLTDDQESNAKYFIEKWVEDIIDDVKTYAQYVLGDNYDSKFMEIYDSTINELVNEYKDAKFVDTKHVLKDFINTIDKKMKEYIEADTDKEETPITDNEQTTPPVDDNNHDVNLDGLVTVEKDPETNQNVYKILLSKDLNAEANNIINELVNILPPEESQKILQYGKDALKLLISTINDSEEPIYSSTDEIAEMTKYMVEDYITNNIIPALNDMDKNTNTEPYIQKLFATMPASALLNNITQDDIDVVSAVIIDLLKNAGLDSETAKAMIPENIIDWITLFVNNTNPEQECSLFSLSASLANAIDTSINPDVINDYIEEAETEMQNLLDYAKAATSILVEYIQKQEPADLEQFYEIIQEQYPEITKEEVLLSVKIALGVIAEKSGYNSSLSEVLQKFTDGESVVFDSNLWNDTSEVTTRSGANRRSGANSGNVTGLSDDDYRKFMDGVIHDGGGLGGDTPLTMEEREVLRRTQEKEQYAKELRKNYPELNKWIDDNGNWTAEASRELSAHMEPMEHLNNILLRGKDVGNVASEAKWISTNGEKRGSLSYDKVEETLNIDGGEFSYHLFQNAFKEDRKAALKRFLEEHPDLKKVLKENPAVRPNNLTNWEGSWDNYNYYTNGYYRPGQPGYDRVANRGEVPDTPSGSNSGATKAAIVNDDGTIVYMGKTYTQDEFINGLQSGSLPNCSPTDIIGVYADSDAAFENALKAQIKVSGVGKDIVVMGGTNTVVTTDKDGNKVTKHYDKDSGEFTGKSVYNRDLNITLYYNSQGELEGVKDNVTGEIYQPSENDLSFEEWIQVYGKYFKSEGEAAEAWAKYQISGEQPSDIVLTYEEWLNIYGKNFHSEGEAAEAWAKYLLEHTQGDNTDNASATQDDEILTTKECPDGSTDYYDSNGRIVKKEYPNGPTFYYNEDGSVDRMEVMVNGELRIEYPDGRVEWEGKFGDSDITWRYTYDADGNIVLLYAKGPDGKDQSDYVREWLAKEEKAMTVLQAVVDGNYGTGANFDRERCLNDMVNAGWEIITLDKLTNKQIYDILVNNKGASFDEILRKLQSANYSAGGTGHSGVSSNYGQTGGQSFGLGDQGFNDVFGNNSYSDGYHLDYWGNWVSNSGFGSNGGQNNWGVRGGGNAGSHY